jgi:hypothetical protein
MPYPLDLVRLAASTRLAPDLALGNRAAAAAPLKGYREGLAQPQPALLDEGETWLRLYAIGADREPGKFWKEVEGCPKAIPPSKVVKSLTHSLPKGATNIRFCTRVAGAGSLGRPRYVAIADWHGGRVLREAKASAPSAWTWAHGGKSQASNFLKLANGRFRAPDPYLDMRDNFILRRIAADSRKIELGSDVGSKLRTDLLQAMGFDLASIHAAGSPDIGALQHDLKTRPRSWLYDAAKTAAAAVEKDYQGWASR